MQIFPSADTLNLDQKTVHCITSNLIFTETFHSWYLQPVAYQNERRPVKGMAIVVAVD